MRRSAIYHQLPGPENLPVRSLMYAMLRHFREKKCSRCNFYPRYHTMIVNGPFLEHVADMLTKGKFHPSMIDALEKKKLIELAQIAHNQHRITFLVMESPKDEKEAS